MGTGGTETAFQIAFREAEEKRKQQPTKQQETTVKIKFSHPKSGVAVMAQELRTYFQGDTKVVLAYQPQSRVVVLTPSKTQTRAGAARVSNSNSLDKENPIWRLQWGEAVLPNGIPHCSSIEVQATHNQKEGSLSFALPRDLPEPVTLHRNRPASHHPSTVSICLGKETISFGLTLMEAVDLIATFKAQGREPVSREA